MAITGRTKKTMQPIVNASVGSGAKSQADEHAKNWKVNDYGNDIAHPFTTSVHGDVDTNEMK